LRWEEDLSWGPYLVVEPDDLPIRHPHAVDDGDPESIEVMPVSDHEAVCNAASWLVNGVMGGWNFPAINELRAALDRSPSSSATG
jgi:hypothetical protein